MSHLLRTAAAVALVLSAACSGSSADGTPADQPVASSTPAASTGDVVPASSGHARVPADSLTVTVYKSPTCGCCNAWIDHMRDAGFTVVGVNRDDMNAIKHQHGVTNSLGSCHTATVAGYVLEGHVPAADVKRLLAERPDVVGLAVPGMPMGSPGMEGPISQKYDVVAFDKAGGRTVFASY